MDFKPPSNLHWVMIGGCPRSGTTGLMNYLNNKAPAALIPEYGTERLMRTIDLLFFKEKNVLRKSWIGPINNSLRRDTVSVGEFIRFVPQWEKSRDKVIEALYQTTFTTLPRYLGEKFPRYWQQDLPFIASQVETLNVFHIFRAPSKVFLSYKRRSQLKLEDMDLWTYDNKFNAIVDLIFSFEAFHHISKLGFLVIPLKYEALQEKGSDDISRLTSFFSISEDGSVLEPDFAKPSIGELDETELYFVHCLFADLENHWEDPIDEILKRASTINFRRRFLLCLLKKPSLQGLKAWFILLGVTSEKGFISHILVKAKRLFSRIGIIAFKVDV